MKFDWKSKKKRAFEIALGVSIILALYLLSFLEKDSFSFSAVFGSGHTNQNMIFYFGLINLNVILILILSFLIFRNVTKLIVDRKRGVFGSQLRSKLVFSLVFFALAPTVLFFYLATHFITKSFDTWFSERVQRTMEQIFEVIHHLDNTRTGSRQLFVREAVVENPLIDVHS